MKQFREKDVCAIIVGGNPGPECVEEMEKAKEADIKFIPFKTKGELSIYFRAADVFVLPTREDIWGLVINEAMAYGLPVITTDKCNAGLELVIDGQNGYLVPTENEIELYKAIFNVLYIAEWRTLSCNSLSQIESYSIDNMDIEIFNDILRK